MDNFDRNKAIEMIEDALEARDSPIGRGIAVGLCSAFYLCGVIDNTDWDGYQKRVLAGPTDRQAGCAGTADEVRHTCDCPEPVLDNHLIE